MPKSKHETTEAETRTVVGTEKWVDTRDTQGVREGSEVTPRFQTWANR